MVIAKLGETEKGAIHGIEHVPDMSQEEHMNTIYLTSESALAHKALEVAYGTFDACVLLESTLAPSSTPASPPDRPFFLL